MGRAKVKRKANIVRDNNSESYKTSKQERLLLQRATMEARRYWKIGHVDLALEILFDITEALPRYAPPYHLLIDILRQEDYDFEDLYEALNRTYRAGLTRFEDRALLSSLLTRLGRSKEGFALVDETLAELRQQIELAERTHKKREPPFVLDRKKTKTSKKKVVAAPQTAAMKKKLAVAPQQVDLKEKPAEQAAKKQKVTPLEVKLSLASADNLIAALTGSQQVGFDKYFLAHQARELAQAEHFDSLLCLGNLRGVTQYAYQVETVRKVLRSFRGRVLLADEVGLGKTIEAGMILKEYILRGMVKKALIVTPPALVSQWCEELNSKFDLAAQTTETLSGQDSDDFWKKNNLIVASLALVRNQKHSEKLRQIPFDLVVIDEAHHVKNHRTKGWKLLSELRSRFLVMITATPVENNLMELYNLITLLQPGQLGTRMAFKREFLLPGDASKPRNQDKLRQLLGEVMIRNTRALADIKLPARHASTILVKGQPAEQEFYRKLTALVRDCYSRNVSKLSLGLLLQEAGSSCQAVEGTLTKMAKQPNLDADLQAEMKKLAKLCRYVPGSSKTTHLIQLLQTSQEKVLVFSRFKATLSSVAASLTAEGIKFCSFVGGMSAEEKDAAVESFRNNGAQVMLCSEVGGEGRNLQFCATMVNYDLPWNPMKIEQRIGRIHRIGQTQPVHIYNLCAQGTAEYHILEVLDKRINLFELVIGEVDLILGQMKDDTDFSERILSIYGESQGEDDVSSAFDKLGNELLAARQRYDKVRELDATLFSDEYEV